MQHDHPEALATDSARGRTIHLDSPTSDRHMAVGTNRSDVFHATTDGQPSNQIHLYGLGGNDTFNMYVNVPGADTIQHGHHIFGGDGNDKFKFVGAAETQGTLVGRLDDFDPRSDEIWIDGQKLDLLQPDLITGVRVEIVEYKGQQWIEIRNDIGGRILYALEGARRLPEITNGRVEEVHFLEPNHNLPETLPAVTYRSPYNLIPDELINSYTPTNTITAPDHSAYNLTGTAEDELITMGRGNDLIHTGDGNNLVRADFGNDTVYGGKGDDAIEGYKGLDYLDGGAGDDSLFGGTDNDTLIGGAGNDYLHGGSEDDVLYGNEGNDYLDGSTGNDLLYSGTGRDTLIGGEGDDTLYGQGEYADMYGGDGNDLIIAEGLLARASGGSGDNLYQIKEGSTLEITDFNFSNDRLDIGQYFEDEEDLNKFIYSQPSATDPQVNDLVIDIPNGGRIFLLGAGDSGHTGLSAGNFILGWQTAPGLPDDENTEFPFPSLPAPSEDDQAAQEDDSDDDIDDGGGFELGILAALVGGFMLLMMRGGALIG
ncbi:MAG: calcium-binding protein [Paracoccus sp. (in: a-proteobacteria)]|uniref:calcium-binding protein n=1 Tax=Paracoccus sp. TaxID=267 RepID=UPI0026E0C2EF|nr:calcium-binding protein [Paracoccus sp. (in: a-proteobacteria)]MDO5620580.1 calcium-binding protein [Paracoccus sp. (in: a-proteobacteria)]